MDIAWTLYTVLVIALILTLAVLVIRFLLAATRALNAYADDRKLRTAVFLDDVEGSDEGAVR